MPIANNTDMRQPVPLVKVYGQLERNKDNVRTLISFLEQVENENDATLAAGAHAARVNLQGDPNNVDVTAAYRFLWRQAAEPMAAKGGFLE